MRGHIYHRRERKALEVPGRLLTGKSDVSCAHLGSPFPWDLCEGRVGDCPSAALLAAEGPGLLTLQVSLSFFYSVGFREGFGCPATRLLSPRFFQD